jgi:PAS domain-containing protein
LLSPFDLGSGASLNAYRRGAQINKHKAAETASEMREQQLRNELAVLSETTSTGLVKIDLDGHFVSANKSWYGLVGLEEGRTLDEWMENMHEDDAEWVKKSWAECVETPSPSPLPRVPHVR